MRWEDERRGDRYWWNWLVDTMNINDEGRQASTEFRDAGMQEGPIFELVNTSSSPFFPDKGVNLPGSEACSCGNWT